MTELRQIAVVADEQQLLQVCRARAEQIDISRETIDTLCRWKSGQASKYLCDPPLRGLSLESILTLAPALGMMLVLVEHEQSMVQIAKRVRKRESKAVRANGLASMFNRRSARRILSHFGHVGGTIRGQCLEATERTKIARQGGKARAKALSKERRREIALNAVTIRWQRVSSAVQTRK